MAIVKQNRNAPCRCGSGKKAKKCCLPLGVANDQARKAYFKSPVGKAVNEIAAAIGGSFSFEKPEEPAIGPPKWATWGLLAFAVVPIIVALAFMLKG